MRDVAAELHLIESAIGRHLFVVDGSRLYDVDGDAPFDDDTLSGLLASIAPEARRRIDDVPLTPPALQTLSLNVAQACNMSCGYCYAGQGTFGGNARLMGLDVARASVDRLIAESAPGADLVVGFMGGEPFVNRKLLHDVMPYAERAARAAGRTVRFSLTTNATLLDAEDVRLLARHSVQVAVSIDGPRDVHDRARPLNGGGSAYDRVRGALSLFARIGRPRHLSARITVTPQAMDLPATLEHVLSLGFDSAGFSPVLVSPNPAFAFRAEDFRALLAGMVECGTRAARAIEAGRRYPFSNFETALHEIERGSHRPYPCGAGAAYLSVNAEGALYACHRLVDDPQHRFGDVYAGSDVGARARHLAIRHVDRQSPCKSCWARYLCGGGCYHEVDRRGRPGCDYIRGWLEFCLAAYAELRERAPGYFQSPDRHYDLH
ncbi:MAG: SPASM domain-containing protein [Burkholderiales bacterium]